MYIVKIGCFVSIILMICSCQDTEDKISDVNEIVGTYVFKYPTGQIEVIKLNHNYTYQQLIYKNKSDYKKSLEPLFINKNIWEQFDSEIEFKDWLEYCKFRDPSNIDNSPKTINMGDVYWIDKNDEHEAILEFLYDTDYLFKRVENSSSASASL
ncbi:MAG: hypothetical protein JNL75_04700 [Chitinophagales bacterium]|nr:hypothetical protein [Chitinophagales bacterium]